MNSPVPFIVCYPRSGSTLLRLMLDAHPAMAIPPETMFNEIFQLARAAPPAAELPQAVLGAMTASQRWNDLHVSADALRGAFAQMGAAFSVAEGLRAFYRLYAANHGKTRFGDKTPGHIFWIPTIAELLPEAVFVHIVRDGRDIAASMRQLWFGPGNDIPALAESWLKWLNAGFEAGAAYPGRYLEVRYEELVERPEPVLRSVLAFIDLPFDAAVLRHHERAAERIAELGELLEADGRLFATREAHRSIHQRTLEPPNEEQVGRFRRDLTAAEIADFESIAKPMLSRLRYIQ
ncbi:MAG: sulfotransferase [Rhizobiales bacterium]|nr:sulfotransferase [Hyphomicrobiales bacterium]